MPRIPYDKPHILQAVITTGGVDPVEAFKRIRAQEHQPEAKPEAAVLRQYLMAPPEPPEIHYLSPRGGYPDGRENRRERRRRERAAKKHHQKSQ